MKMIIALASAATLFAGSVSAQDSVSSNSASTSGPITYIGGDANLTATVDTQVAAAIGQYVYAENDQASVLQGSVVKGAVNAKASASTQVAAAIGQYACAANHQASIGARSC